MNGATELAYGDAVKIVTLACMAIPFVITFAMSPVSMKIAPRIGAIDVPRDERRMHKRPVPLFGGFAIFVSVMVALLLFNGGIFHGLLPEKQNLPDRYNWEFLDNRMIGLLVGGTIIFLTGVIDDIKGMKPLPKLLMQVASASAAFGFGMRIDAVKTLGINLMNNTEGDMLISFVITVVWIVAIINMMNLIDGMDGLAAGVAGISSLAIAYAAYIHGYYGITFGMCIVAGAAFGFLPFNFYPAKSFMGDGGSMFLGFMLASLSFSATEQARGTTVAALIGPVIVLAVPMFDVLFAMFRRAKSGASILSADNGHLHHQLSRIGLGQRRTVVMLYGITGVMGIAAILLSRNLYLESIFLFCVGILFMLVLVWKWNVKKK